MPSSVSARSFSRFERCLATVSAVIAVVVPSTKLQTTGGSGDVWGTGNHTGSTLRNDHPDRCISTRPTGAARPYAAEVADDDVGGLWDPDRRALTIGLLLTITLVATEALAVATVMPEVRADLGGYALYGWVFSGFFLASIVGI